MEIVETLEETKDGVSYLTDVCYKDETKQEIIWTWARGKSESEQLPNVTQEDIQAEMLLNQVEILGNQAFIEDVLSQILLNQMEG